MQELTGDESMDLHPLQRGSFNAWLKGEDFSYVLKGKEVEEFYRSGADTNFNLPNSQRLFTAEEGTAQYYHVSMFKSGGLYAFRDSEFPEEAKRVMKRFASVFNLTYNRFLDLQKAESQAREAQMEAALERVRAAAMAMHKSDDLQGAVKVMFEEFQKLNLDVLRCGVGILNKDSRTGTVWATSVSENGLAVQISANESFETHPLMMRIYEFWQKQEDLAYVLQGQDLIAYYRAMDESELKLPTSQLPVLEDELKPQYYYAAMFNAGGLYAFRDKPFTAEDIKLMKRFANVLNLTYNRFLDLQKAEAQARESQIQLALERVRARTMAMQKSHELPETSKILFQQIKELGEPVEQLTIGIVREEENVVEISATLFGASLQKIYWHSMNEPYVMNKIFKAWKAQQKTLLIELQGEDLNAYNRYRNELTKSEIFPTDLSYEHKRIIYCAFFSKGVLALGVGEPRPPESLQLLKRFASVFDLTYTRFLDLKNAESQAREAKIEASLERVRSKAMAMQKSEDLADAVAIVFEELDKLNLGMLRCGIGILNKEKRSADVWTTTKSDNNTVVQVSGDESMDIHPLLQGAFKAWESQADNYNYLLKGDDLNNYYKALTKGNFRLPDSQSLVSGAEGVEHYYYNAIFSSGGLFAFRETEFPEEAKVVLRRFADVFSLTYTRFNDLKVAEAHARQAEEDLVKLQREKKRAEDALAELRITQAQLIQSEKMASLGELTAGIAHEIQNPLNFINNFSEVSAELADEIKEALNNNDKDDAIEKANDIRENLQKITHHGKRADAIVKGMLQHSRASTGKKEATDINALADEYLRLSYHGLRAKDKTFNASMETHYDKAIGTINIISHDIGRVILNLFTNAFYSVTEKKKISEDGYMPTVCVSTKKINDTVEIRIKDNGMGIPQKVLDKIYQPFFTTKPTGKGTGLGLSLSYDIIKAHNGQLAVETREGQFAEFIINLPTKD